MLLAIGYVLITEDDPVTNPLIDWDFMRKNTIGFDRDSLPEGANPIDNYRDYVLGLDENGNRAPEGHPNYPAKTPEWAAEICGVPPEKIRSFAIELGQTNPVAFMESDASARINSAQSIGQVSGQCGLAVGGRMFQGSAIRRHRIVKVGVACIRRDCGAQPQGVAQVGQTGSPVRRAFCEIHRAAPQGDRLFEVAWLWRQLKQTHQQQRCRLLHGQAKAGWRRCVTRRWQATGEGRQLLTRAPSGSYRGSAATSAPTHSPKTSTSARCPIAARFAGR